MGSQEKLLAGAKQCLRDRGYARTTARDVAAASGANLASIGYHFGSMERLLTAAMIEGIGDWGDSFGSVPTDDEAPDLEATWTHIIASFEEHRPMLMASFEAFVQSEHLPELRTQLAEAYEQGREGLAALFLGSDPPIDPGDVRAVGSVSLAMMTGLIAQWLTDPARAPHGRDVAVALSILGASAERARARR